MMILFFLLMPLLWNVSLWYEDVLIKDLKTRDTIHMNINGNALTTVINKRFALLEGLFAFAMANPSDEDLKKNFDVFALGLYSGAKGIRVFALAPGGVQRYVYPFRGNETTPGHDLINDSRPEVRADVLRAINTRKMAISGPYELRQGGLGLVARKALYVNDTFWGLVTMAIDMPPIFEEAMFYSNPRDIEVALRGSSGNIFLGNRSVFENEPLKLRIELPDGYWEVGVIPPEGWHKAVSKKLLEFQAVGLIVSVLIAIIIYLLISRYSLLDEKNEYLKQSYQNLKNEVIERKKAEEKVKASLLEKETMLKEIHHRVKNNLQVISSLLNMQSSYLQDENAREALQESMARVRTMAMIHTQLYQSQDLTRVDCGLFIRDLIGNISQAYGRAEPPVAISVDADEIQLDIDTSIPCGLILNELVTNALKYAFPEGRAGKINIRMRSEDNHVALTVQDNGIGFPESIDSTKVKSLGLELVNILVGQMNGKIDMQADGGTMWNITFPLKNEREWKNG
jgi:two-component sensor histidine kinase/sensor domain CHASE-containing protein